MNNQQYYDKYQRDQESKAFYISKAWLQCRELALIRDNYLCQKCLKQNKITSADMVHHIKELKDHPELSLDLDNLESLCHPCHNREHPEKGSKPQKKISKKIKVIKAKSNPEIF
ncbi:HNH endonuclease [Bacillus sp. FJAT-49705]|uniref:Putative HNH nuclease YajD n=1 Tax=Cytobacillus citreus TaxID=2833586 RepID=A0ABS5NLF1_9BACI|nr:HNH endonuclease signature motif containing protein [Cytobacillus citreus]MBS4188641.1 HNH endonuclease [Cytobacillus citreus]